jgi:UDP-perosamine 4-acetyltransferase
LSDDSSRSILLLGAGGHAKVVVEALRCMGRTILGVVTPDLPKDTEVFGVPVLGDNESVYGFSPLHVELVNGIGALPGFAVRWDLCHLFRKQGYWFAPVIHPSAVVAPDAVFAEGVQIMAGVVIQPGVEIGSDSIINTRSSVDHDCRIGRNCHLAPGVIFSGGVTTGAGCHIGVGSCVVQGISIGDNVVIAAGSVVYKNISSGRVLIQTRNNVLKDVIK